jgi:hypothetical protein
MRLLRRSVFHALSYLYTNTQLTNFAGVQLHCEDDPQYWSLCQCYQRAREVLLLVFIDNRHKCVIVSASYALTTEMRTPRRRLGEQKQLSVLTGLTEALFQLTSEYDGTRKRAP